MNVRSEVALAILVCATCVAGCVTAPPVWVKDTAQPGEFEAVKYQCYQETKDSGNFVAQGPPLFVAIAANQAQKKQASVFGLCMNAHGWHIQVPQS